MASHLQVLQLIIRRQVSVSRASHRPLLKSGDYLPRIETSTSRVICYHHEAYQTFRPSTNYSSCHGRYFQATPKVASSARNDWLPETEELYSRLRAEADRNGWVQTRNTNTDPALSRFVFSRVVTANGPVIHFALFVKDEEKKMMGVCQFGEEAQGTIGFAHGGATATILDAITGLLTQRVHAYSVTASMTVNFKRPTPIRSALLMEANIDQIDGRKTSLKACLKSPDGAKLYSECNALYVRVGYESGTTFNPPG